MKRKERKEKKKKLFYIDFTQDIDESAFTTSKASTTLSATVLDKASETSTTLPPDVHYDMKMLAKLFNKPQYVIPSKRVVPVVAPVDNINNEIQLEENGNKEIITIRDDDNDIMSGAGGIFADDFEDDDAFAHDNAVTNLPSDMVDEPRKVDLQQINYSKTAKKIDVKVLKDSIWDKLCNTDSTNKKTNKKMESSKSLQEVLTELPKNISEEMASEISVPFCFICLLHIANEQNLELTQPNGKLNELFIEQSTIKK